MFPTKKEARDIRIGDVIAYRNPTAQINVSARVVDIEPSHQAEHLCFWLEGGAVIKRHLSDRIPVNA